MVDAVAITVSDCVFFQRVSSCVFNASSLSKHHSLPDGSKEFGMIVYSGFYLAGAACARFEVAHALSTFAACARFTVAHVLSAFAACCLAELSIRKLQPAYLSSRNHPLSLRYNAITNSVSPAKVVIALIRQRTARSVEHPLATIVVKKAM